MKAVTLWPEWAWAICCLFKRIENRGWGPPLGQIDRPFLLHAGASIGGRSMGGAATDRAMRLVCETARENGWHYQRVGECRYELEASVPVLHPEYGELVCPRVEFRRDLIPCGAFVAVATIDKVSVPPPRAVRERFMVRQGLPAWSAPGAHHWHLRDVTPLTEAVTYQGAQRLWSVPDFLAREAIGRVAPTEAASMERWRQLTNGKL